MATTRPFRFASGGFTADSKHAWAEYARRVEALGYATLLVPDHVASVPFAPVPALVAAADATTTLRVACTVLPTTSATQRCLPRRRRPPTY